MSSTIEESERELNWFFSQSTAAMGMQSNFSSVYNAIMSSGASRSSMPDSITEARLDSAARQRSILVRLRGISPLLRDVIYAAYQPRQYERYSQAFFGDKLIAVTPFCDSANIAFESDAKGLIVDDQSWFAWLESIAIAQETERMSAMRTEAQRLFDDALIAYSLTAE